MATWNKSWKSFYQKKSPELKTKYPFLKEYQIREKVKKLWAMDEQQMFKDGADFDNQTPNEVPNEEYTTFSDAENVHEETSVDDDFTNEILNNGHTAVTVLNENKPSIGDDKTGLLQESNSWYNKKSLSPHVAICCTTIDQYTEVKETDKGAGIAVFPTASCISTINGPERIDIVESIVDQCSIDNVDNRGYVDSPHGDGYHGKGYHGEGYHGDSSDSDVRFFPGCVSQDKDVCQAKCPLNDESSVIGMFQPMMSGTTVAVERLRNTSDAKRRVFRSSTSASSSNFYTLFTDDDDFFM